MKKFQAIYKEEWFKEDIIVHAKDIREARQIVDSMEYRISCDWGHDSTEVLPFDPKLKFDKDNVLNIYRNKVVKPKLTHMRTFYGDLVNDLIPERSQNDLVYLTEKEKEDLRKSLSGLIEKQIAKAKKRYKLNLNI